MIPYNKPTHKMINTKLALINKDSKQTQKSVSNDTGANKL